MTAPSPVVARVTVEAPINIAFIKYWGKRDGGEELILPCNDSFSITLSTRPFRSRTTVELRGDLDADELWLNGARVDVAATPRVVSVLRCVRAHAAPARRDAKVRIVSDNNFPTAAGMASSASGYCALAAAVARAYDAAVDVSMLARLGSGSACRSVHGGFVIWHKGERADGSDCVATQFVDENYWPEMQVLCAVLKGSTKDVSSTAGMQRSLRTSPMMAERVATVVPRRMRDVSSAIRARDFDAFAAITMADSDDLQAVCRTTDPPIQYATDDSYAMIRLVRALNASLGRTVAAYTFDAGANCFLFTLARDLPVVFAVMQAHFPTDVDRCCFHDTALLQRCCKATVDDTLTKLIDHPRKPLEMLLQSPVGPGVVYVDNATADAQTTTS